MRAKLFGILTATALISAAAMPAAAHHSFAAEFDVNRPIRLEGTVVEMEWINPHAWIHLDVENESGEVERWMIEGGAPNSLLRRGWTKDSLLPGTEILVEGYQAKDGSLRANGSDITFEDGTKLFIGTARVRSDHDSGE